MTAPIDHASLCPKCKQVVTIPMDEHLGSIWQCPFVRGIEAMRQQVLRACDEHPTTPAAMLREHLATMLVPVDGVP